MDIKINAKPNRTYSEADFSGLFGGSNLVPSTKEIVELGLSSLVPYQEQPFKPYKPDKLELLVEDIKENGVLSPIIVRPKGSEYEILAGHNRTHAARKAGLITIPAIITEADDATAALIMVNTNLNQRDELLPSEKAYAYKIQLKAMTCRGKRYGEKTDTYRLLGQSGNDSRRNVARYVRLTYLLPSMLEMVDNADISFCVAVDLSYLKHSEQQLVLDISSECERKISTVQSGQLKKASEKDELNANTVLSILTPVTKWNPYNALSSSIRSYMPKEATSKDIKAVLELIETYFKERSQG